MKSWQTSLAGVGAIMAAVGGALKAQFDGDPTTIADWSSVVPAIIAGVCLLFARDNNKTSEQVLAK